MHSSRQLFAVLLLFLYTFFAAGLPTEDVSERSLAKRYNDYDIRDKGQPSDYPSDDDIRRDLKLPAKGKFVFYAQAGQSSDSPDKFAASISGKTLNMAAPPGYFEDDGSKSGKRGFNNFVDRASGIYADAADGEIFFVAPWNNGIVDYCRVWSRVELQTIATSGKAFKITLVNKDDIKQTKDITTAALLFAVQVRLAKSKLYCNDWDGYGGVPASDKNTHTGYQPGQCGFHFTQYQKNEGPGKDTSVYRYSVQLKDNAQEGIGSIDTQPIPDNKSYGMTSTLPYVLVITSGALDADTPVFKYGSWTSSSSSCSIGKYDNGARQGDCGFPCPAAK